MTAFKGTFSKFHELHFHTILVPFNYRGDGCGGNKVEYGSFLNST
jgi:hypothetical protein